MEPLTCVLVVPSIEIHALTKEALKPSRKNQMQKKNVLDASECGNRYEVILKKNFHQGVKTHVTQI